MIRLDKFVKILALATVAGLLSGCLSSILGSNGGQYSNHNPYRPSYQNAYQQPYYQGYQQQGQLNRQGTLQNPLNRGTLQNPLNQGGIQGTFGRGLQAQNQQPSVPPGYSESGYQPGYPDVQKPSFQGWSDPDKAAGIW
jgi:hypothetical protein